MIFDLLSTLDSEEYLYIDLDDIRVNKNTILKNIELFLKEYPIKVLVLENIEFDKKLIKKLYKLIPILIFSSKQYCFIEGFNHIEVKPLDFEEFLLFENSFSNITQSFNHFLKYGNMPISIEFNEQNKVKKLQEYIKLMSNDQTELLILKILVKSAGETKSILQLFNSLKKEIKISKDRFYSFCNYLEDIGVISFLPKFNQPRALKRVYIFDFILTSSITFQKNFNNIFSNMIFCELKNRFENIFYIDGIDFYISKTDSIILSIPFFNEFQVASKSKKLVGVIEKYGIKNINIVTVNNEFEFTIADIECQVEPFYQWALE